MGKKSRLKRERRMISAMVDQNAAFARLEQLSALSGRLSQGPVKVLAQGELNKALGLPKMSTLLEELAKPLLDIIPKPRSHSETEKIFYLTQIAWNLEFELRSSEEREQQELPSLFEDFGPELSQVIATLIIRKLELFPDDPRVVLGYDVQDLGGGHYYLSVSSSVPGLVVD